MPPRLLCPIILAFWLGMMAWLFQRDIWPRLAPGEPPPFTTNLADAKSRGARFPTNWTAQRKGPSGKTEDYRILLFSRYDKDDHYFEYRARWEPGKSGAAEQRLFQLGRFISNYRVWEHDGTLKEFDVEVEMRAGVAGVPAQKASFIGVIDGRVCNLSWQRGNDGNDHTGFEPFPVSLRGVVLMPLHPLDWMTGLRPGQKWGVPAFDPLGHAGVLSPKPAPAWVNAHVRTERVGRRWKGKEIDCLVVDYSSENLSGSTWVDATDSRVLFMEVRLGDDHWEIRRE